MHARLLTAKDYQREAGGRFCCKALHWQEASDTSKTSRKQFPTYKLSLAHVNAQALGAAATRQDEAQSNPRSATASHAATRPAKAPSPPPVIDISDSEDECEDPVRLFLRSVHPPMDDLTYLFTQGGVVSGQHLEALAAMPEDEQTAFLKSDLKLNPFQARLIRLALVGKRNSRL
jgi:hypothetical protein